jgi:hypothetical protein
VDKLVMRAAHMQQIHRLMPARLTPHPPVMGVDRPSAAAEFADTAGAGPDGAADSERDRLSPHDTPPLAISSSTSA